MSLINTSTITGIIARRVVVSLRITPEVIARILPPSFQPKVIHGWAIAGLCLTRLSHMRLTGMPAFMGIPSENCAHRIVVSWFDENGNSQDGVYLPLRHTDSALNILLGKTLFPAELEKAQFDVTESDTELNFRMSANKGRFQIEFKGTLLEDVPAGSIFSSAAELSDFQEQVKVGFWTRSERDTFDAHQLQVQKWSGRPMRVDQFYSSYFSDADVFPPGSVEIDSAFFMHNLKHTWLQREISPCAAKICSR